MPSALPFAPVNGIPLWPVPDARRRVATYGGLVFGAERESEDGTLRYHAGVDILAPKGSVVVAPESGILVREHHFLGPTRALLLQTDSGPVLLLGEVEDGSWEDLGVSIGDRVAAGTPIARVGVYKMLHFETYRQGTKRSASWARNKPAPGNLYNPTLYLETAAAGEPVEPVEVPHDHHLDEHGQELPPMGPELPPGPDPDPHPGDQEMPAHFDDERDIDVTPDDMELIGLQDMTEYQRRILDAFPPGQRTPDRLAKLWNVVYESGVRVIRRFQQDQEEGLVSDPGQVQQMNVEATRWVRRMGAYRQAIESGGDMEQTVVRGFLINYPGSGHHVSDMLFPFSFARRAKILEEHFGEVWETLFEDLEDSAIDLAKDAWDKIKKAPDAVKDHIEKGLQVTQMVQLVVIAGLVLWLTSKTR